MSLAPRSKPTVPSTPSTHATTSSNSKTDYRRNRVRAELLPHLASYYNQCVGDSLLRLSQIAAADTDLLNELARESFARP